MKITIASILAWLGIGRAGKQETKVEMINPAELKKGPIQRENLSEEQLKRIDAIRHNLAEVSAQTREQWIDNFKRDLNPDKEIEIWEQIAEIYQKYCSNKTLSADAKEDVFSIILLRSMTMSEDDVLKSVNLKQLTDAEARELMRLY